MLAGVRGPVGDLEFHLRRLPVEILRESEFVSPAEFLNGLLELSAYRLTSVRLTPGQRNLTEQHAPSVWNLTRKGFISCEKPLVDTHYYLYTSLVRLLEPHAGHG